MNYYLVTAKCGHVGTSRYISIVFPVKADSGKEAAQKARRIPRVKHDHKDAIINVEKVSYEEFFAQRYENDNDPYLHVFNKRDQNLIEGFENRLIDDNHNKKVYYKSEKNNAYKIKKQKIKFSYNDFYEEDFAMAI